MILNILSVCLIISKKNDSKITLIKAKIIYQMLRMSAENEPTVLICDDDEDLLFLAYSFLSKKHIKVLKATTGQEALDIYKNKIGEINLVILDNTFKNSKLQGQDILLSLKKIDPTSKVLISSGYPENYFKEMFPPEAYKLIDGFIDKNYSSPTFIKSLESYFK